MYYNYGQRSLTHWMNDPRRSTKLNQRNIEYLRKMKEILHLFGRNIIMLVFIARHLRINEAWVMYKSMSRQRDFVKAVCCDLKKYAVAKEDVGIFEREIAGFERRVEYILKIAMENIRFTEYYPYFSEVGIEKMSDFCYSYSGNLDEAEEILLAEIAEWNASHAEVVNQYLESIRDEKEMRQAYRDERARKEKEEKELKKTIAAVERIKQKQTAKEVAAAERERKKLEKSFEHLYKDA